MTVCFVATCATIGCVDKVIAAKLNGSASALVDLLADLSRYPGWLDLVQSSIPEPGHADTWMVTLRTQLGPLARSKRLRMQLVERDEHSVRFERNEIDNRNYAPWVLSANVVPAGSCRCEAVVTLHYGGKLWSAAIEKALVGHERSAIEKLDALLRSSAAVICEDRGTCANPARTD